MRATKKNGYDVRQYHELYVNTHFFEKDTTPSHTAPSPPQVQQK